MMSYIYWDPNPKIFTLPFVDRPIVWYGVLFALGFFLAYRVFEKLIREYLCLHTRFTKKDFSNFSRLIMSLKNNKEHPFIISFLHSLPESLKEKILLWNFNEEVDEKFKEQLINCINAFVEEKPSSFVELNDARLKKVFTSLKTQKGKFVFPKLKKRLKFEEMFPQVFTPIYTRAKQIVEKIVIYTLVATIIGARLGHILFYEDISYYFSQPLDIVKTWEGGLASHGGIIGICIAFIIYKFRYQRKLYPLSMLKILDFSVIAACLTSFFIRLGNFVNQEVLGVVSNVPWAIVFGHPLDGSLVLPRHPAQLYEGLFYLGLFFVLLVIRNHDFFRPKGKIAACFFTIAFTFRFFIEFIKEEQSIYQVAHLNMGQLLSLPIIVFGVVLFFIGRSRNKKMENQTV